jgi:hypothetical protein
MTAPEQRRTPRIDVRHRLNGYFVSLERPAIVRDLSLGGFSVETDDEVPAGVHLVRLREGDRWSVTVTAASRHHRTDGSGAGIRHITGFEYEDQNPDTQQTIRVLFERLVSEETVE